MNVIKSVFARVRGSSSSLALAWTAYLFLLTSTSTSALPGRSERLRTASMASSCTRDRVWPRSNVSIVLSTDWQPSSGRNDVYGYKRFSASAAFRVGA